MPTLSPMTTIGAAPPLKTAMVSGGVAGNITVTGIRVGDVLASVNGVKLVEGTPNAFSPMADLTGEFTVTANDTINNTGGTATTGALLFVSYFANPLVGR